jgi:cytochrome c5
MRRAGSRYARARANLDAMGSELRRIKAILTVVALNGLAAYGCSSSSAETSSTGTDTGTMPEPCSPTAPTACPDPPPKYADVKPVFDAKCVTCHSGAAGGPWPLNDYGTIASWQSEIRGELLGCSMPPVDAGAPLTNEERMSLLTWIQCGAPQ